MKKLLIKLKLLLFVFMFLGISSLKSQTNQYLSFDGTNDWVSVPNASSLVVNSTTMSITGWFFDNNLNYGQGIMGFRTGTESFYLISLNSGQIEARFINSSNVTSQPPIPAGTIIPNVWQHYAFVYDGTHTYFYLNGNLVGSATASGTLTLGTTPFAIGKSPLGSFNFYYNGNIDEVSLWKKALSQAEIQDVMQHEINTASNPVGLLLYYKFNQGVPAGNNTGISKLTSEVNSPLYDGDLTNFALTGATSNFNGTLNTSFQAISFPQLPTKLTTSPPFALHATASSGLKVSYNIVSGPATLSSDSIVTLTGAGTVKIKAFQNGNAQYDSATSITNTFDVVDPALNLPIIEARHPLAGNVYMDTLSKIQLAALASINYPSIFSVQELHFKINGQTINAHDFGNGHYTAWWQPSAYGNYAIEIISTSNLGAIGSSIVNVNILPSSNDTTIQAFSGVLINTGVPSVTIDGQLPSFLGAYDTIIATLTVSCPNGGCGEWDHIANVEVRSHEGNWFELIRYITPYGTACSHKLLVTDYASLLNGKVTFRVNCGTLDNGYLYALTLNYRKGPVVHRYSQITQIWNKTFAFGDYANLQPVNIYNYTFPSNVKESKIKLISTGHGWGSLNTGNAAEFYDATHHIYINNVNTFTQHNWANCNPNPDNCMPQNGTWQYNRAGWCPGSIARPFDYSLTSFIPTNSIALKYVFYEQYIDQCHPNNPACVTGSTCTDCSDGFNPQLVVACNLVNFFDVAPPDPQILNTNEIKHNVDIAVYPNPSKGLFNLSSDNKLSKMSSVVIYNLSGKIVQQFEWSGENISVNLTSSAPGLYIMKISNENLVEIKKIVIK
ncbi:MAG: LamG-like jellyroll fold domain-containing protein [Bacteroidales bacterium]